MPPFKSGKRTRHFKGMIYLILKKISKSDQMNCTCFVYPLVLCWALEMCNRCIKDWVRWICLPETATLAIMKVVFSNSVMAVPVSLQRKQLYAWSTSVYKCILESQCFQHLNSKEHDLAFAILFTHADFNCNPLPENTQALSACAEPDVYESWCLSEISLWALLYVCLWWPWSQGSRWHVEAALN